MKYDVYLYGMVLMTTSHLLKDTYPKADTYGEFTEKHQLPGGETGTCATVLASLGTNVLMDGNHLGTNTYSKLHDFYKGKSVDLKPMTFDKAYEGLEDFVFIDQHTRTCFGTFAHYFSEDGGRRWNQPKETDIEQAKVVGLDPFFYEATISVAKICHQMNKPFVTIDCGYDTVLNEYAAVNIISNEFIGNHYKDIPLEELFQKYTNQTEGLVIFTFGNKPIWYGRKGQQVKRFTPYEVKVVSTLGAGDTFKAGAIYGLLKEMDDDELVAFASTTAGAACMYYPLPLNPPTLQKIKLIQEAN